MFSYENLTLFLKFLESYYELITFAYSLPLQLFPRQSLKKITFRVKSTESIFFHVRSFSYHQ